MNSHVQKMLHAPLRETPIGQRQEQFNRSTSNCHECKNVILQEFWLREEISPATMQTQYADRNGRNGNLDNLRELGAQAEHQSKAERYRLRQESTSLADSLEMPVEQALKTMLKGSPPIMALRIALEGWWLQHLAEAGEGRTVRAAQLSAPSGAE